MNGEMKSILMSKNTFKSKYIFTLKDINVNINKNDPIKGLVPISFFNWISWSNPDLITTMIQIHNPQNSKNDKFS